MTNVDSLSARAGAAAPLADAAGLVTAMKGVATRMAEDLVERARDPRIEPSLRKSHQAARDAHETSEAYEIWRKAFCDQVAASWVLCAVFVRTLEDRGFLPHRLAGPGAVDRLAQFRRLFRYLSERDYLLHIFDALAEPPPSWPAGRDAADWMGAQVFGRLSAPLWKLSPSQRALAELLDVLRSVDASGALRFTFGRPEGVEHDGSTTRFLGDLYQDLNADVRKRYALLQTPDFVERFILDQTLTPALQERGIAVTLCDPACGSGHFLLGAYDRLFEARQQQEPGRSRVEVARQALSQVYGVDLNPYAAAIARFRLLLSFLDKAGLTRLDQIPPGLHANIFVGDSLLAGRLTVERGATQQFGFGDVVKDAGFAAGAGFSLVDPATDQLLKSTRFDVVVGNPPYITEKDAEKRELIRRAYPRSAAGKYALAAPFVERLFDLCNAGGWMGQITANSFMKREFGTALVESYLPTVDLSEVIDTSGAYIPGHGTPTVLLFGRHRRSVAATVQLVMGTRGEPNVPADPARGLVWSSIERHHGDAEFENLFVTVGRIDRIRLAEHPWSLGGGGAAELKQLLEGLGGNRLSDVSHAIGIVAVTGDDDVYLRPRRCLRRIDPRYMRQLVEGDQVRDWSVGESEWTLFPYDEELIATGLESVSGGVEYLWPYKATISKRKRFGTPMLERGLRWYELQELYTEKLRTPLSITFAEIASHNHFILAHGGRVFKQTAPVIKLAPESTEQEHLALVGYLNTALAAFYFRQIGMNKGSGKQAGGARIAAEAWDTFIARSAGVVGALPMLDCTSLLRLSTQAVAAAERATATLPQSCLPESIGVACDRGISLKAVLDDRHDAWLSARRQLVFLQEELDWAAYSLIGLPSAHSSVALSGTELAPEQRAFEIELARRVSAGETDTTWFERNARTGCPSVDDAGLSGEQAELTRRRLDLIAAHRELQILEAPEHKRRWEPFDWDGAAVDAARSFLLDRVEDTIEAQRSQGRPLSVRTLARSLEQDPRARAVAEYLHGAATTDLEQLLGDLMRHDAVASATAQVYTDDGIEKRRLWEETWALQRREDAGEKVAVPVPPKYEKDDFEQSAVVWRHRGKLDVPKERFIAYPTATPPPGASGAAGLVFGWAGWTHLEQLQAAIALWQDEWAEHGSKVLPRATRDARDEADPTVLADHATREKLLPILQTMVDLLPWVRQWHNDDGETADQFENYVKEECRKVEMSIDEVHLFRLAKKVKAPRAPKTPKTTAPAIDDDAILAAAIALANGGTVEAKDIAERLGVAAPKLKDRFDALVERGALIQTKARPRTFKAGQG